MYKLINRINLSNIIRNNVRYNCVNSTFNYKSKYSAEDTDKILTELNDLHINDLSKYNITKARLKKFEMHKTKVGKFKSIEQLLEIDGFGEKILENFCNSILTNNTKKTVSSRSKAATILTPKLTPKVQSQINSCISIHINIGHISWSRLEVLQEPNGSYSSYLTHWDHCEIEDKKIHLSDLIKIILYLNKTIPQGDVYIFENEQITQSSVGGSTPGSMVQINVNVQKIQLISMLSLILTNRSGEDDNNTFFLRKFVAARLFGLFVGNEKVSTESIVQKMLNLIDDDEVAGDSNKNQIELNLQTSPELVEHYCDSTNVEKELHGQSLLLGVAFIKLCIQKCPKSFSKLMIRSN